MPAKGDRPAGPCLGGKTGATSPPGARPENLVAAARAAGVTDPRALEAIRYTPGRLSCRPALHQGARQRAHPPPRHQVITQPSLPTVMIAAPALTGTEGLRARCRAWLPGRAAGRPGGQHRHLAGPGRAGAPQPGRARHRQRRGPGRRRNRGAPEFALFGAIIVCARLPGVLSSLAAGSGLGSPGQAGRSGGRGTCRPVPEEAERPAAGADRGGGELRPAPRLWHGFPLQSRDS